MNSVNKTLYIPLCGKAYVSRLGLFLRDPRAEAIWAAEGFPLKGKAASKWLAYYMSMRSAVFDAWLEEKLAQFPDAVVLHLGCGLDSRCLRVGHSGRHWYDIDFSDVIRERQRYFEETETYHMVCGDLREDSWLAQIPRHVPAILVMEGVSMYLTPEELRTLLTRLRAHFSEARLLMDNYTTFAAKASKYKNPINQVGVTAVYGFDGPKKATETTGFTPETAIPMTPKALITQLPRHHQTIFQTLYVGKFAQNLYQLYSYRTT